MKNNKGFVLAETLVVAVFLMVIFGMIYKNYYPLVAEYEKKENYDDLDGKYAVYWLKKLIEDKSYKINGKSHTITSSDLEASSNSYKKYKFIRFECKNITDADKKAYCKNLVKELEIEGCNNNGNKCEIYITTYKIGDDSGSETFKKNVKNGAPKYRENCNKISKITCQNECKTECNSDPPPGGSSTCTAFCNRENLFKRSFMEYIMLLPDYVNASPNGSNLRVTTIIHHKKDSNNYYSYATIEVKK